MKINNQKTRQTDLSAREKLAKYRRHKRWMRTVSVLAAVMVFVTTYSMILPTLTATRTDLSASDLPQARAVQAGDLLTLSDAVYAKYITPPDVPETNADADIVTADADAGVTANANANADATASVNASAPHVAIVVNPAADPQDDALLTAALCDEDGAAKLVDLSMDSQEIACIDKVYVEQYVEDFPAFSAVILETMDSIESAALLEEEQTAILRGAVEHTLGVLSGEIEEDSEAASDLDVAEEALDETALDESATEETDLSANDEHDTTGDVAEDESDAAAGEEDDSAANEEDQMAIADDQNDDADAVTDAETPAEILTPSEGDANKTGEETELTDAERLQLEKDAKSAELPVTLSRIVDGVTVTAAFGRDVFPAGVQMLVHPEDSEAYAEQVADATGRTRCELKPLDIQFVVGGQEVEPDGSVQITFEAEFLTKEAQPAVVHVTDDGSAEAIASNLEDGQLTLTTDSFSVYVIAYTVDFAYEGLEYSLDGGSAITLSALFEVLGIEQPIEDVESVAFSDGELVWIGQAEEETTIGALKEAHELECEYSTAMTEEQIAEIDAQTVEAGEWVLISVQPFTSEESLTVTMKNGEQFVVRVTDAQISTHVITADGEDYVITVTYEPEAGIPDGATLEAEEILLGSEEYDRYYQDAWEAIQQVENYEELTAFSSEIVDGLEENIGAKLVPTVFDIAFMRMFDISLMYENQEIEPKAPVQVTVTYANTVELSANDEAEVVHFVNNDVPEVLEVQTDKDIESNELSPEELVPFDTEEENKDEQSEFNSFSFIQSSFSVTATIVKENNSILPDGNYVILMHTTDWYALGANGGTVATGVNYGAGDEYDLDENLIWTITYNGDGTYSVKNGDNYLVLNGSNITGGTDTGISIELSNGSGYQRAMFKNGSQKLGWNTNVNPSAFFSTNNSNQSYYLARAAVDIIDTTGTKEDDRVHYIITDHYPSGDVVRVSDYLSNGQSLSVNSNANADNLYAGVSVTAGHDAVSIGNNGAITISYNSNVHLVHLDYYYKEPLPTVQTVLFDNDDKYDTKIVEGQKYYELGEERLHTEKTASVVEGGDGRSFNLTLEAWNVDWRIATIGMVLDASGSMAWDGAAGHKMQVNSDGKYTPYKFLSQTEVNKILYTDYSDYSPAGYGDYTYYVYEDGKSVNEYAPLGYFNGANKVTSNGQTYITQDGTLSTAYATQVSIQDKRAGWYYVNTGNATPYKDIGGSKEYDGISTSSSITNHSQSVVKADGTTKSIDFANNNGYSSSIKEWFVDNDTTGTYRKTSTYGSSQGTPAQFYVDDDGYLHCFYMHSNQIFESFVYKKTDEETIKTEMLQDAIGSFTGTLYSIAPDSAVGMTRFSRSNTTNKNGFDDNQLPLLNWTMDSTAIIGALNQAYGGEYLAKSSKTDSGYGNAGNLTVYDYGLTGNTSTQSGLTSFNTYLASSNAALTKWAQDNAKPVQGGYEYDKYVIVFTDGKDTDRTNSYSANAKNAADALKKKGYNVITVLLAPESAFGSNGSLNTEFTDAKNFLDTLNGARTDKVVSGLEWTDTTYIASASDKSALKNIFIEIAQKIAKTMEDMTIRDYIDPRFRLVDENDNPISLGEHPELGFTLYYDAERDMQYVEWTGQDIPTNNVVNNTVVGDDGQPAEISLWSQTIRVRAKDDFLGGNEVLSNGNVEELNKVYPDGHPETTDSKTSRTFPRTTVDPQVLGLELGTTEDTLYLGETIDATEHDKLEDAIGATVDSSWYYEYLTRYGKVTDTDWITQLQQGRKVEIPYYYIPDGTTKSTFDSASLNPNNLDAYMKDQIGTLTYEWVPCDADGNEIAMTVPYNHLTTNTDDIHYRLKIKYTPYTEDQRYTLINSMIDTDEYDRDVKDHVGTPQTVVESAKNEGIATVHVVSGQVTVSKQIKKEDILKYLDVHEDAVFTFKLTKTGSFTYEYPEIATDYVEGYGGYKYPDSISVTVTKALVNAAAVNEGYVTITGTTVDKLPIGTYEIEEITPSDSSFEFETMGHLIAPENYRAKVADELGKVTFILGEIASDANVSDPVLSGKEYLNAQQVSVFARNKVNLAVSLSIKKMDIGNSSILLADAVFSLYNAEAVDEDGKLKEDAVAIKTGITTLDEDNLGFADLGETSMGTYYLVETNAPVGYVLPEYEYIKITLNSGEIKYQAGKTGEPKTAEKITRNGKEVYCIEVFNSAGVALPSTGGPGTLLCTVLGSILVMFSGVSLILWRRRRAA